MSTQQEAEDAYHDDLAAYALGALDLDETAAMDAHRATCPQCRAELRSFRAVTVALAADLDSVALPEGHQRRFAQKLRANVPVIEPVGHRERFAQKLQAQAVESETSARPPAPAPRRWWEALNPFAGWGTAGALAFALLLALWWGAAGTSDLNRQLTSAQATAQVAQQQAATIAATSTAVVAADTQVLAILGNPATRSAQLAGNLGAQVRVWVDPTSGQTVLRATNLPTAPAGRQYELWLLRGTTTVAVNLFQPSPDGLSNVVFSLPAGAAADYTAAALTVEQRLETAPTSAPIMKGQF